MRTYGPERIDARTKRALLAITERASPGAAPGQTVNTAPRGSRALAWTILGAAVAEVVAPLVTINGPGSAPGGSGPDLLIAPVGWAFSIWGVIYLLAIVQAVAVLARGHRAIPRRLQIDQVVLYVAATAWIVVAGLDSSVATAIVLSVMLVAAIDGILVATHHAVGPSWPLRLTRIAFGLYSGWVTAAFFLNLSTAMVVLGLTEADEVAWQVGVLAVAVVTLLVVVVAARGSLPYAAGGLWALVGVAVTGATGGPAVVTAAALLSAAALLLTVVAVQLRVSAPAGQA